MRGRTLLPAGGWTTFFSILTGAADGAGEGFKALVTLIGFVVTNLAGALPALFETTCGVAIGAAVFLAAAGLDLDVAKGFTPKKFKRSLMRL